MIIPFQAFAFRFLKLIINSAIRMATTCTFVPIDYLFEVFKIRVPVLYFLYQEVDLFDWHCLDSGRNSDYIYR